MQSVPRSQFATCDGCQRDVGDELAGSLRDVIDCVCSAACKSGLWTKDSACDDGFDCSGERTKFEHVRTKCR